MIFFSGCTRPSAGCTQLFCLFSVYPDEYAALHCAGFNRFMLLVIHLLRSVLASLTVCCGGFLMGHQHSSELLQLVPPDDPIQVHLLENAVRCQLLTSLVLKQRSQHPRPLLSWGPIRDGVSLQSTVRPDTHSALLIKTGESHLLRPEWCSAGHALEPPGARSRALWICKTVRCSAGLLL